MYVPQICFLCNNPLTFVTLNNRECWGQFITDVLALQASVTPALFGVSVSVSRGKISELLCYSG